MKPIFLICFLFIPQLLFAAQKAKIAEAEAEVYKEQSFDSEILSEVHRGEEYLISDKTFGAFYKIKLKNGKIGYIADHLVDIEGKGRLKPKDLDQVEVESDKERAAFEAATQADEDDEEASLGRSYSGVSVQFINFHEEAFGSGQVADLVAVGYKSISMVSWSVLGAFKAPPYYADKTGGSVNGLKLWADLGYSSTVAYLSRNELRFSGSLFTQFSMLQVETPVRKYDLHDITLGIAIETALLIKIKSNALDLALKYYFDKSSYAGLGISFLF